MSLPLFIKPNPGIPPSEILFFQRDRSISGTIAFRSLDLATDLDLIHSWTSQRYSARFWQLNVEADALKTIYQSILDNPLAHSFIGLYDNRIVCQIDCYHVSTEEINTHVPGGSGNCGLHILMCPPRESIKGLTELMLRAFTEFFFSHTEANTLYGEPDIANQWGNIAAKKAGFHFQKTITLSYKTANLYSITREQFSQTLHHDIKE